MGKIFTHSLSNPSSLLHMLFCDLGLRDYTLNFPKSFARWFSVFTSYVSMGDTGGRLQRRRMEERIPFQFLQFTYISLTAKGSYGSVAVSPTAPSTNHLLYIRGMSTGYTAQGPPQLLSHTQSPSSYYESEVSGTLFLIFSD